MRRRLVVAIAVVAAGAVALFAIPLAVVLEGGYRDQELLRLQRDTVAAARSIDLSRSTTDTIELPAGKDRIAVYDGTGARVAGEVGSGPPAADTATRDAIRTRRPTQRTPSGALVVAVPLLTGEQVSGAIRAQRSDAVVADRARRAWLMLGGAALVVVALAVIAAVLLGRRLAAPLERLAVAAGRLGDGDFSVRAPRGGIPEVDEVATALDATAGRLDELMTRERAFTAGASHQLRTPLAALRLELEAQQLTADDPKDAKAALIQVDRLQQTVEALLAYARGAPIHGGRAELTVLLDDLQVRWHGPLAGDGRPLRTVVDTEPAEAAADPRIIAEILNVLVDNAHRHGAGAVTITVRAVSDWVAVDVADEGQGFHGNDADHGFPSASGAGHGIGLALARSLADAQGGRLSVTHAGPRPVFTLLLAPP